jgi:rubrerythrin/predicted phosphodiesterase
VFKKVTTPFIEIPQFSKLSIIGDPGCDGLGAATMSIFARALSASSEDLTLILGDIVPVGTAHYYRAVLKFINRIAVAPVYTLCGNHDTEQYNEFCGLRNYALYSSTQLVLILDNSERYFSNETLQFAEKAIHEYQRKEIIVAFHIPPPNQFTNNSIPLENWESLYRLLKPVKKSISGIVTGHVHSFFRDTIDSIPLIVSGGGGARIEFVHSEIPVCERVHHYLTYESSLRSFTLKPLDSINYLAELEDEGITERLENAYINETQAHFRYKLYAEQMEEIGEKQLAHLFRALSDSEYHHAKNHYSALNHLTSKERLITEAIAGEAYEVEEMYCEDLAYSNERDMALSSYSFRDSLEAEKVHLQLLENAQKNEFSEHYFSCTSCGFTFTSESKGSRCPVCGAPEDKILGIA